MKHCTPGNQTPGMWLATPEGKTITVKNTEQKIADINMEITGAVDNSRLMAAAPELKEALDELLDFTNLLITRYKPGSKEDKRYQAIFQKAHHALSRSYMGGQ